MKTRSFTPNINSSEQASQAGKPVNYINSSEQASQAGKPVNYFILLYIHQSVT
jgi:hypothetical protein